MGLIKIKRLQKSFQITFNKQDGDKVERQEPVQGERSTFRDERGNEIFNFRAIPQHMQSAKFVPTASFTEIVFKDAEESFTNRNLVQIVDQFHHFSSHRDGRERGQGNLSSWHMQDFLKNIRIPKSQARSIPTLLFNFIVNVVKQQQKCGRQFMGGHFGSDGFHERRMRENNHVVLF